MEIDLRQGIRVVHALGVVGMFLTIPFIGGEAKAPSANSTPLASQTRKVQDNTTPKFEKTLPPKAAVRSNRLSCTGVANSSFGQPVEGWPESRPLVLEGLLADGKDQVSIEIKGEKLHLTTILGLEQRAKLKTHGLNPPEDDPYVIVSGTGNYIVALLVQSFPELLDTVVIDKRSGYAVWTQTLAVMGEDVPYTQTLYLACR